MLRLLTFLAATVFVAFSDDCTCFIEDKFNAAKVGDYVPINNPFTAKFKPCGDSCGFVAYSGNDTWGWKNLALTWPDNSATNGYLTIYDGKSSSASILQKIQAGSNAEYNVQSSTSYIYIEYTYINGANVSYYGSMQVTDSLYQPPTNAPTLTTPFPTNSYSASDFVANPSLISHDLLIVINPNAPKNTLDKLNEIATNLVSLLQLSTDVTKKYYSRIGLTYVSSTGSGYSSLGTYWSFNLESFKNSLQSNVITVPLPVVNIDKLINEAFAVTESFSPSRPANERTLVLLTGSYFNVSKAFSTDVFDNNGAGLVVVSYNLNSEDQAKFNTDSYNYKNILDSTNTELAKFINPYLLNSNAGSENKYCKSKKVSFDITSLGSVNIAEPSNYGGPTGSTAWSSFTGQSKRYCSFLNRDYTISNSGKGEVTFTVYYELEIESDFVRIYEDGVETKSFTGVDVSGSTFTTKASNIVVRFNTDFKGVYSGFYLTATLPPTTTPASMTTRK